MFPWLGLKYILYQIEILINMISLFFRLLELVMSRSSTTMQYLSFSWHVNKLINGTISCLHITTNYWFHTIHVCSLALDDHKLVNLACFWHEREAIFSAINLNVWCGQKLRAALIFIPIVNDFSKIVFRECLSAFLAAMINYFCLKIILP